MNASIKLGRILGIPVGLHISWFIVFGLLTWSLATGFFPVEYPQFSAAVITALAVSTSVLFFASVLAHELGHSLIAIRNKIPVKGITLFIFGGVAQIGQEPHTPGAEFRIAFAGPLVSLGLAALFGGLGLVTQDVAILSAPSLYLARINLILAVFNMIPGFPLDGGRVLRALVWQLTGSFRRATRIASFSGQLIAFGFIGLGIFSIFNGGFSNGLWLAFIGWFLQNAAASANHQLTMKEALSGTTVSQVMSGERAVVHSLTPISQVVEERVLRGGQSIIYIADQGQILGILTLQDITSIPQAQWRFTTAGQAMTPMAHLLKVKPETELLEALQTMDSNNLNQMPVVVDDRLIGTLSRERIVQYLRLKTALNLRK